MIVAIVISLVLSAVIAIGWASGITNMHKHHKDYKGDDFLNNDDL